MIYGDNNTGIPSIAAMMQSGNLYVYCGGNPVNRIDIQGQAWEPIYKIRQTGNEAAAITLQYGWNTMWEAKGIADTARDAGVRYAENHGFSQTWDNEADAYRHFKWNFDMNRKLGNNEAAYIANTHELFGFVEAGRPIASYDNVVITRFDRASLMDLWNNKVGRALSVGPYRNAETAFSYALNKGYLITDVTKVFDFLGITDYVASDGLVTGAWNWRTGNITFTAQGKATITLKIGI